MARIALEPIKERVAQGLITERKHPQADLWIYNYTPVTQFKRLWDEYTLMCRGLILDAEGNIIARPFPKFFNLEEYQGEIPKEDFGVAEKMDGSLGIMYFNPTTHDYDIATRGSFTSDQAVKGTQMLHAYNMAHDPKWINDDYTYLFEIIYPANRIVVNYGAAERLVLLACVNTKTGAEDLPMPEYTDIARFYMHPKDPRDLASINPDTDNREGYVVRFKSGLRLKFKFEEYVRLHRLLTQVSSKSIWDLLRRDEPIEPILDNIPDEFYKWVMQTYGDLQANFLRIKDEAAADFEGVPQDGTMRDKAEYIKQQRYPAVNFMMLQGKPTDTLIWKMVKPVYEQPFRVDIDG